MRKVPVFEVIRFAWRFLFHEFGTIVRLIWFPLLIVAVVQYAAAYLNIEGQVEAGRFDRPAEGSFLRDLASMAVSVVGYSMALVAIHRIILFDDRRPGTFLLFSFARAERVFMGFALIIVLVVFVGSAILGGFGVATGMIASAPGLFVAIAALLVVVGVYFFTRLLPLYPVMVVEKRLNFRAAFALSRGNFWRLFWVTGLGMLPVIVVWGVAAGIYASVSVGGIKALVQASDNPVRAAGDAIQSYLLGMSIGGYIFSIIQVGLGVPLICYSYKALRNIGPFEYLDERANSAQA